MTCNATSLTLSTTVDSRELFGFNLKRILEKKGMLAEDLAKALGVPRSVIYRWNMGETLPIKYLDRIAESLDEPISEFFEDPTKDKSKISIDEAYRVLSDYLGYEAKKKVKK